VTLRNPGGQTDVVIDDSADSLPTYATIDSKQTTDASGNPETLDSVRGGDPLSDNLTNPVQIGNPIVAAPIQFLDGEVHSLTVRGGSAGNRFYVDNTGAFPTELDSGTGQDSVNVFQTTGPLTIDGQDGNDTVTVGLGPQVGAFSFPGAPLEAIQGPVKVMNAHSHTDLIVDDSADPLSPAITIDPGQVAVASTVVAYDPSEIASLTVKGVSAGGTSWTVNDTAAGASTTLDTGTGDQVNIVKATGSLKVFDVDGTATINGSSPQLKHVLGRGALSLNTPTQGVLAAPTEVDRYALTVTDPGTLSVQVEGAAGSGLDARATLYGVDSFVNINGVLEGGGGLLFGSSDPAPGDPTTLQLFLLPGQYFLEVSSAGGAGAYTLTPTFTPGPNPLGGAEDADVSLNRLVGKNPVALVQGDFNRDGVLDVATANHDSGDVSVLLGVGNGSFDVAKTFKVAGHPDALVVADFNNDGRLDLATLDETAGLVTVLLGLGDGNFRPLPAFHVNGSFNGLAAVKFNPTGPPDLALLAGSTGVVTVLPAVGDGTFSEATAYTLPVGDPKLAGVQFLQSTTPVYDSSGNSVQVPSVTGDFTRDGVPGVAYIVANDPTTGELLPAGQVQVDIAFPTPSPGVLETPIGTLPLYALLGNTPLAFLSDSITPSPVRATPLLADLNGKGTTDLVIVSRSGDVLFRAGPPGQPGVFAAPVVVNDLSKDPNAKLAQAVTVVRTGANAELAAIDLYSSTITLYQRRSDGSWAAHAGPATGIAPELIVAGDLNGDGIPDLVVANNLFGVPSLSIYRGEADGSFTHVEDLGVGLSISDVELDYLNGDKLPDLVVTAPDAGVVGVLRNEDLPGGDIGFQNEIIYRAGAGPYGVKGSPASDLANQVFESLGLPSIFPPLLFAISNEETVMTASGDFTGDGATDLVVANKGTGTIMLLRGVIGADGKPTGDFADPELIATTNQPTVVQTADLTGDGRLDLVVLNVGDDTLSIFLNQDDGTFVEKVVRDNKGNPIPLSAGDLPTGLSIVDVNGDHIPDLVVGNRNGDVLILLGNGDGTFRPFVAADQRAPLVLTQTPDGKPEVILANEAKNVATEQVRVAGTNTFTPGAFQQNRSNGLIGPGAIAQADLNNDGIPDLIIANSGSNNVLVYLGLAGGGFSATPQSFSVGDNPVGLYVARLTDTNGDGKIDNMDLPDLVVANQGSNDVSVLLGSNAGGTWTFQNGPRLSSGGVGPIAVTSRPNSVTGVQDLLVTNGQDGTVAAIPGIGNNGVGTGFFNDAGAKVQQIASGPVQQTTLLPSSNGDLLGVALTQNGSLMRFDLTTGTTTTLFTPTAGNTVNAFQVMDVQGQAFPVIFAANANHSVSALVSTDGQSYTAKTTVSNAALTGPSALEVLQTDSAAQFDVYLTDAGQSTPVVLALDLNAELTQVNPGGNGNGNGNGNGDSNQDPSSDTNGSAGLVITLVTNLQVDTTTTTTQNQNTVDPLLFSTSDVVTVTT
jgi:FG-GAP-like repeat